MSETNKYVTIDTLVILHGVGQFRKDKSQLLCTSHPTKQNISIHNGMGKALPPHFLTLETQGPFLVEHTETTPPLRYRHLQQKNICAMQNKI